MTKTDKIIEEGKQIISLEIILVILAIPPAIYYSIKLYDLLLSN